MKRILTTTVLFLILTSSWAQSPEKMTYQAVVRNASDQLVTNSAIGMQISILQSSPTGIAVFIETHSPTTNNNGLATVEIGNGTTVAGSFSGIDWSNGPYFLKTETDPTGGTVYTISGTTQLLSVPYALHATTAESALIDLVNDADADATNELQSLQLTGQNLSITNGNTVTLPQAGNTLDEAYDQGGPGAGRIITVDAGEVELVNGSPNGIGLRATTTNTGVGVLATSSNTANGFSPIQATTTSSSNLTSAIVGSTSGGASAVSGQVESTATAQQGVYGNNLRTTGGYGVYGIGHSGTVGETNYQLGFGVYGRNYDAIGPLGNAVGTYGYGYVGVWGDQTDPNGFSIYANGDFGAAGTKAFAIDHPLDPEEKYLKHYSVESNEVLNMYRGTVAFNDNGEAMVTMPDYFDAVNANFSYQLTPIGGYAPLYIKEKLNNGVFVIAGGQAGMEVSWTVYAERNDPYLQQHPESKEVEVEKEDWNKGKYLQPDLYDQPDSKKIVKPLETGEVDNETGVERTEMKLIEN
jgi:hypothetical protein